MTEKEAGNIHSINKCPPCAPCAHHVLHTLLAVEAATPTSLEDDADKIIGNYNKVRGTDDAAETARRRKLTELGDIREDFPEESVLKLRPNRGAV